MDIESARREDVILLCEIPRSPLQDQSIQLRPRNAVGKQCWCCRYCPQGRFGRCSVSVCCCILFLLLSQVVALIVRVVHRNHQVTLYREPLLTALDSAAICKVDLRHPRSLAGKSMCALEMGNGNAAKFDLSAAQNVLLGFLYGVVLHRDRDMMKDVLGGAHICVKDERAFVYNFLIHLPGAYERTSSHRSTAQQYGTREGRVMRTMLIGRVEDTTWFQLEGSPMGHSFWSSLNHILDFYLYRLTRRQMGPLGSSPHTDWRPVQLSELPRMDVICPVSCKPHAVLSHDLANNSQVPTLSSAHLKQ